MGRAIVRAMPTAMREIAIASRDEFVNNFDTQGFDGTPWDELIYRTEPPPKLMLTRNMYNKTKQSIKTVTSNKAVLINDAVDSRGRSYSGYHNTGTEKMAARPIMSHTDKLERKHLVILAYHTGRAWVRV